VFKILVLVLLIIAAIIFGPLLTIASINTLFGTAIPYTFWTWASVAWLQGVLVGTGYHVKSK
jgi:hypothetical protein